MAISYGNKNRVDRTRWSERTEEFVSVDWNRRTAKVCEECCERPLYCGGIPMTANEREENREEGDEKHTEPLGPKHV